MKIGIFSLPQMPLGKHNLKDSRLDQVDNISKAKKKTYIQVELVGEEALLDADVLLVLKDSRTDLVLKDLEFVETRLSRAEEPGEKALLEKLKNILERESTIFDAGLTDQEKEAISAYGLFTNRPLVFAAEDELADIDSLLSRVIWETGFISFFTTGERETRAWLIKRGTTAWEAAGEVHSDIQKGFIRAEIISFVDFVRAGGETQAKEAGKLRLEQKDYVMQDGELAKFRFNK